MPQAKPKVELISHTIDPQQVIVAAIRQCYSKVGASDLKEKTNEETRKRLINQIVKSGHTSTIEHASFTFAIEGISRAATHQLVRHRIASYSQQSQRYVRAGEDFDYILPPSIENDEKSKEVYENTIKTIQKAYRDLIEAGIEKEDARFLLPNAAETKIVVTMNARSLLHFFEKRLCTRAQWEIRILATKMLALVKPIAPDIFAHAGASCQSEKICWEGDMSCGMWENIEGAELRERS